MKAPQLVPEPDRRPAYPGELFTVLCLDHHATAQGSAPHATWIARELSDPRRARTWLVWHLAEAPDGWAAP